MIVVLLVLIILLMAPWMFWWFVGAVATWVLVFSAMCSAALILWPAFRIYRAAFPPKDPATARLAAKNKEFNRKCMEESRQRREKMDSADVSGPVGQGSSDVSPPT